MTTRDETYIKELQAALRPNGSIVGAHICGTPLMVNISGHAAKRFLKLLEQENEPIISDKVIEEIRTSLTKWIKEMKI